MSTNTTENRSTSTVHTPANDAGWIDPRLGGLLAFMAAGVGVLFLPLMLCSVIVVLLLLATVVLFSVGDVRTRRTFDRWVTAPALGQAHRPDGVPPKSVAWAVEHNDSAGILNGLAEPTAPSRRQSAARLDPGCESCRQRAATVMVQLDGSVFRVCAECAPQPVEGLGGAA